MSFLVRSFLISIVLLVGFPIETMSLPARGVIADEGHLSGAPSFLWNSAINEAPFLPFPNRSSAALDAQLVYPSGDFTFPLAQSLYYDAKCDCYSLTLSSNTSRALRVAHFWRTPLGFYRTANGPYLELENLDSLKALTDLHGRRFLFAQVGDGDWHCVSIHDSSGGYLLIDYRADGLISRLRDSFSRVAAPTYYEGRITSLNQQWTNSSGREMRNTLINWVGRE